MKKILITAYDEFIGQEVVIAIYDKIEDEQKAKEKAVNDFTNLMLDDLNAYELK